MAQPFEIIMSPADVYVALAGEPAPNIDAVPGGNWVVLGYSGKRNQNTAGVKINGNETLKFHTTAGATGNVKAVRTMEEWVVETIIEDLTVETFSKALNNAGIREVVAASGVAGYRGFGLKQGFDVTQWAILVRAPSPYYDGGTAQFWSPVCVENGTLSMVFDSEGTAVGLALKYITLEDPNAASESERFGIYLAQTGAALP
jgi:hypothetical protein